MHRIEKCIGMALPCPGLIHDQIPKPPKNTQFQPPTGANGIMPTLQIHFDNHKNIYWMNLSRFTAMLIILNISLFFVTELVTRQGYYYTYFLLLALFAVESALLVPVGLVDKLWYYRIFLAAEIIALYFLFSSVWFWVSMNKV